MYFNTAKFILLTLVILPSICSAEDLVITFDNHTGEMHKGCVAYGYRADGSKASSGVKPVAGIAKLTLNLGNCAQFKEWRFVAAVDYSDNPENADVVLMDTGKRPVSKCTWTVTGKKNQ